jgi:soluble lytic murein transglycosylase-like protein
MLQTQNPYSRERIDALTTMLAGMDARGRQAYAAQHKNDPAVVATAVHVNNIVIAAERSKAMQAGGPRPTVVDQNIAAMTPAPAPAPVAQTQLPENQGIARIPAPNMQTLADGGIAGYGDGDDVPRQNGMAQGGMYDFAQRSEPVVRMAGGGMPGYKNGKDIKVYEDRIRAEAARQGVDPDLAVRMFITESGGKKDAVSPKGAAGLGQLMIPAAKEMGLTPAERFDPDKNIPASIGYLKKQLVKYDGDTEKALAAYNWGPGSVDKHLAKNQGKLNKAGLPKETADYLTKILPVGTAVAEEVPGAKKAPVDTSTAAQIPGQSVQAPASNYDQTNSFFGRMADKLGIPLEAQRQIGTTLNAPTPLAPVVGSTKAGSSGIAALGEKVAEKLGLLKGPPGSMSKAEIAALQKDTSGLKALEATQQATKEAQAAGATLEEQEYLRKMIEANRASQVPSKASQIAEASLLREGQDVATAQRLAQTGGKTQTVGRVDALTDKAFPTNNAAPADGVAPGTIPFKGIDDAELQRMQEANQAPMTRDDIVKAAEEATPAKERKGFSNDDLLTLGLNLLASKSPNFMTALGEAGLATVAGKKEREKLAREQTMIDTELGYKKAKTKESEATAALIERGGKEKNLELQAEQMIYDNLGKWEKTTAGQMALMNDPTAKAREESRLRTAIYASLGIKPIIGAQSAAPSGGGGFKFLGVQ